MKINMKKALLISYSLCILSQAYAMETITILASAIPQGQILRYIAPQLAKQGVQLKVTDIDGFLHPNKAVEAGDYDANFFQHEQYFQQFKHDYAVPDLVKLVGVDVEPMGLYASTKLAKWAITKNLAKLPKGSTIAIPLDLVNQARALRLLAANKMISLTPKVVYPTLQDITSNPYQVKIIPAKAYQLFTMLHDGDVSLAVISSNFMLEQGINPVKAAVFIENKNSSFVNIVVVRKSQVNTPKMKKLAKILTSNQVKNYILYQYNGAVIPAF